MQAYNQREMSEDNLKTKIEELMLTSDELSALDNVSVRMVDGDFKSCNKEGTKRDSLINETQPITRTTSILFHPNSMIKIKVPENQRMNSVIDYVNVTLHEVLSENMNRWT